MPEYLLLTLEAPLLSFGGPSLDHRRPTEDFPGAALLAGLLGNALGWRRGHDAAALQQLQDALAYAARLDREPAGAAPMTDLQTVAMSPPEQGWTTYGEPQGRERSAAAGGNASRHLRYRDYHCDLKATVALTVLPPPADREDSPARPRPNPSLAVLRAALKQPARPLFLGRKACLPSAHIYAGARTAETAVNALLRHPLNQEQAPPYVRIQYPETPEETAAAQAAAAAADPAPRRLAAADRREWAAGRHAGRSANQQARIPRERFPNLNSPV